MKNELPLHVSQVEQARAVFTKINFFFYSISLLSLLYYRFSTRFQTPTLPWLLITMSELLLSFFWVCSQTYRWRPVTRTVFPERLPPDEELPPVDVFIFTCDPRKEPTIGVMNTVISAMCLDYPPEKLSVYLSDDGGARITLLAAREAYKFAGKWIPFCKEFGIQTIAPEAYFSKLVDEDCCHMSNAFHENLRDIKKSYDVFTQYVEKAIQSDETCLTSSRDHDSLIEVMHDNENKEDISNTSKLPLLVYVSRERRPNHHHHFKAGAINVLLRVSAMISNAPYLLFQDCDMYCNDPMSARQAMCFHLDPHMSPTLAFVQFPQSFHNLSKNDIYNMPLRTVFQIWWHGLDGLMGPILTGTNFFLKRDALYKPSPQKGIDLLHVKKWFGASDELIATICGNFHHFAIDSETVSNKLLEKAKFVASCNYEEQTQWGEQVGFRYHSVLEDLFTGMFMHGEGWISVYYNPRRPAFLGSGTTNLYVTLVQGIRWSSGMLQVGLSRYCPLVYGLSHRMSISKTMNYTYMTLLPLNFLIVLCHSIIPQLCLLKGIALYPRVADPFFTIFIVFYICSPLQQLFEALSTSGSLRLFWNEQKLWFMRAATSNLFAFLDILKKWIGMMEIDFSITDKSSKENEIERYQRDIYDFDIDARFQLILTTIVSLNIISFAVGIARLIMEGDYYDFLGQIILSFVLMVLCYPVLEAMVIRKDGGRVPTAITLLSLSFVFVGYHIGALIL